MTRTEAPKTTKSQTLWTTFNRFFLAVWKHCGYGDAQNLPRYNFENFISASDPVKNKGVGAKKKKCDQFGHKRKGVRFLKAYTSKAVAAWLDISERRVRQLRDEKVITEIRPGLYDLKTVNHQYINYLRKTTRKVKAQ